MDVEGLQRRLQEIETLLNGSSSLPADYNEELLQEQLDIIETLTEVDQHPQLHYTGKTVVGTHPLVVLATTFGLYHMNEVTEAQLLDAVQAVLIDAGMVSPQKNVEPSLFLSSALRALKNVHETGSDNDLRVEVGHFLRRWFQNVHVS